MKPSDEELVRRFGLGDATAFDEVVARWNTPLFRLAYRLTGDRDAARDVRQMALIQTYRGLARFRDGARLSTWLYRVVLNLCRDRHRREEARARAMDRAIERAIDGEHHRFTHLNGHAPSAERESAEREVVERVADAVLALPAKEREVVVLRHYHDLAFPAIAEIVGSPVTTVKSRMTRGLGLLRTRLADLR